MTSDADVRRSPGDYAAVESTLGDDPVPFGMLVHLECLMERDGIRMKELAEKAGVHRANLSKLKSGQVSAIYLKTLGRLCVVFGCQPGDLITVYPAEDRHLHETRCPVHGHRWRGATGDVDPDDA